MKEKSRLCQCGCSRETNHDQRGQPRRFLRGHNKTNTGRGWIEQGRWYVSINGKKKAFHRFVYEQWTGTTLRSDQVVHHIDGNPLNNDPGNLTVLSISEHMRLHRLKDRSKRWTPEEGDRLLVLYESGLTIQECALVLERSYSGTRARLSKLRSKRSEDCTAFETSS